MNTDKIFFPPWNFLMHYLIIKISKFYFFWVSTLGNKKLCIIITCILKFQLLSFSCKFSKSLIHHYNHLPFWEYFNSRKTNISSTFNNLIKYLCVNIAWNLPNQNKTEDRPKSRTNLKIPALISSIWLSFEWCFVS